MDILDMGAQLLQRTLGENIDLDTVKTALAGLIGGEGGELDLSSLVQKMMGDGGLQGMVSSWLGDAGNAELSPDKLTDILGAEPLANFSNQLGIGQSQATDGLAQVLPQLVDKASSGGELLQQAGGIGGLLKKAKQFF